MTLTNLLPVSRRCAGAALLLLMGGALGGVAAQAASPGSPKTAQMQVSATVPDLCTVAIVNIVLPAPTVTIGNSNISISAVSSSDGRVNITCPYPRSWSFYAPVSGNGTGSQRRMLLSTGAYYVNYSIRDSSDNSGTGVPLDQATAQTQFPYHGIGIGSVQSHTIQADVPAQFVKNADGSNATNPPAGTFADTATFTVDF